MAMNPLLGRSFRQALPSSSVLQSPFLSPLAALAATATSAAGNYAASQSPLQSAAQPAGLFRRQTRDGFNAKWEMYGQLAPARNQRNGFVTPPVEMPQRTNFSGSLADRFAPGSPLSQAAGTVQSMLEQQASGRGVVFQPGGYGSPLQFQPQRQSNDVMQDAFRQMDPAMRGSNEGLRMQYDGPFVRDTGQGLAYTSREQALQDYGFAAAADEAQQTTQLRNQAMWDRREQAGQTGRGTRVMQRRQRALENKIRGQQQNAIIRGIDPSSSRAAGLYPELYQQTQELRRGVREGGSPLTQGGGYELPSGGRVSPVRPDAPKTAENVSQARGAIQAIISSVPLFANAGIQISEDGGMPAAQNVAAGLYDALQNNPGLEISDQDLKALQDLSVQYGKQHLGEGSPFDQGMIAHPQHRHASLMMAQLASLPRDNPSALRNWLSQFRGGFSPPKRFEAPLSDPNNWLYAPRN